MPEVAAPLSRVERGRARVAAIERLADELSRVGMVLRQELAAFAAEDLGFGRRDYAKDELGLLLGVSGRSMQHRLEEAQLLVAFPVVMARVALPLAEGGWSLTHADALLEAISGVELTEQQQAEVVQLVVDCCARTPHEVRKAAQAAILVLDPEAAARRWEKAKKERTIRMDVFGDGAQLSALGSKGQVAVLWAAIDAHAGPKQPGDDRTMSQRRFDALLDLVCGRAKATSWQALVVVSLATLEGPDADTTDDTTDDSTADGTADVAGGAAGEASGRAPAEIPGVGVISAAEARELLQTAELRRVVVDEHGTLVSVDGHTHRPPAPPAAEPPGSVDRVQLRPGQAGCGRSTQEPPKDAAPDLRDDDEGGAAEAERAAAEAALEAEVVELLVASLSSDLEQRLRDLLDQHALAEILDERAGVASPAEAPSRASTGFVIHEHPASHPITTTVHPNVPAPARPPDGSPPRGGPDGSGPDGRGPDNGGSECGADEVEGPDRGVTGLGELDRGEAVAGAPPGPSPVQPDVPPSESDLIWNDETLRPPRSGRPGRWGRQVTRCARNAGLPFGLPEHGRQR